MTGVQTCALPLAQEVNYSFTVFATSYDLSGPRSSPVSFLTGECVWHATN